MAENICPGLFFTISPFKKQPQEKEEENILVIAPFSKRPRINFGESKINQSVQRSLLIINSQATDLDLIISSDDLKINNFNLKLEKDATQNLKITWQPDKPGNFNFSIQVEAVNLPRLKFTISAFGICIKPEEKKTVRKPLATVQSTIKIPRRDFLKQSISEKANNSNVNIQEKENL
ncbi:unnamed protein product [Brachionus calyciflorus]|uniref:Abnormal spindle-like microcephaly-associated protein ASH domain-containing protein n=1 Tax=Brachionus calyciflorus TaxID=104777 RepID=A0A813M9B1_9BILA|nr:unnamed protein product [Brachionus calyciflorus]